jgi:hypothetical protein
MKKLLPLLLGAVFLPGTVLAERHFHARTDVFSAKAFDFAPICRYVMTDRTVPTD